MTTHVGCGPNAHLAVLDARCKAAAVEWAYAHSGPIHRIICWLRRRPDRDDEAYERWRVAFEAWARAYAEAVLVGAAGPSVTPGKPLLWRVVDSRFYREVTSDGAREHIDVDIQILQAPDSARFVIGDRLTVKGRPAALRDLAIGSTYHGELL